MGDERDAHWGNLDIIFSSHGVELGAGLTTIILLLLPAGASFSKSLSFFFSFVLFLMLHL